MSQPFVHLRVHTEFSLIDSVVRVPELVAAAAAAGMPALALTDQSNLFAMVKFHGAALKAGIKPVIGVDLLVDEEGERQGATRLTLLCQSQSGYRNLSRLLTRAYLEGQGRGTACIARAWLAADNLDGLIALSGAAEGDVGRALVNARERDAERLLSTWLALFPGRFYLELQRLGRPAEESYIAGAVALAARRGVPVVATNDVRFLKADEFESHEARVCIHDGTLLGDSGRVRRYTRQQYLRTPQEMAALFADVPEALANSVEIARRCSLQLELGEARLPQYPLPAGVSTEDFLRDESAAGLCRRFPGPGGVTPKHRERLARELEVICQMGFA
ncbi:MAG: PHP domain-containing protein, partial [Gammaproteobacteria bacterium]|nr:PHP domain-containing protein [Gammaproteobacteria bacterium]